MNFSANTTMPKSEPTPSGALATISGALITNKQQLAAFQANTAEQLAVIGRTESLNVKRRLFVGLALLTIKASLKHGQWLPWLKQHAKGASYRQCAYMMALAQVFLEDNRGARSEVAALPASGFALEIADGAPRKLVAAAEKFTGELTWGELLDTHGLKDAPKLGGARAKAAAAAPTPPDEEQLYLFARDEIGGVLQRAEELLVKENQLQYLARQPAEVRGVVESLRALADKVEAAAKPILAQKAG